jgi:hypothetical protein
MDVSGRILRIWMPAVHAGMTPLCCDPYFIVVPSRWDRLRQSGAINEPGYGVFTNCIAMISSNRSTSFVVLDRKISNS